VAKDRNTLVSLFAHYTQHIFLKLTELNNMAGRDPK